MKEWLSALENWQTLASGLIALAAALIGATLIFFQIRQARSFERDRILRRRDAVRSTLPIVLSNIIEYTRGLAIELVRVREEVTNGIVDLPVVENRDFPTLPRGDTSVLADVIEASPTDIRDSIAYLLVRLQVQASRIRSLQMENISGGRQLAVSIENIDVYIWDAVEVYLRCEALFPYARRQSEAAPPDLNSSDLSRGLLAVGVRGRTLDELRANIPNRTQRHD